MKKLLIIYYSWSNGNTERIAKMLQSETDSDILKIDTVVPYSGSYDDVVNQGQNEVQRGYEPEIKPLYINIAEYGTTVSIFRISLSFSLCSIFAILSVFPFDHE